MAAILPKLALRVNTNPNTSSTGLLATYNLDMSWTNNMYTGNPDTTGQMVYSQCEDKLLPVYTMREVLSTVSTRSLVRTGYGVRLQFNVEVEWVSYRNYFIDTNPTTNGSWVADLDTIVNYLGGSTTGDDDDDERYFWLSPNYQTPDEQWIRVEPDADSFQVGFGSKTWTRKMSCSFIGANLYKTVTRKTRSVGWTFSGTGNVSITYPPGFVLTGSGTSFLRDFYPGYQILVAGTDYFIVDTVDSNTLMHVVPNGIVGSHVAAAYTVIQQPIVTPYNTTKNWYYPVYTFTNFSDAGSGFSYNFSNVFSGTS